MKLRLCTLAFAVVLAAHSAAPAIAPSDQIVSPDPPGQSLYSVVDFFKGKNATQDVGTGSIIGKFKQGQIGYFCVLTADHVVAGNVSNFIGVGTNGGALPPNPQRLPFVTIAAGGSNPNNAAFGGTEDLRIVRATVGNIVTDPNALAVYNSVTPLKVANPKDRPLRVGDIFTEFGYGDTGTAVRQGGVDGYKIATSNFIKRFQNNTVASITGNIAAPNPPYIEEQIRWNTVAPANNNGQGTSFGGDSGGPYLSSFPSNITITRNGNQLTIPNVLTEFIVGVHAFSVSSHTDPVDGKQVKLNGDPNGGVYIDQADYDWIQSHPCPEPSGMVLLVIGGLAVVLWVRWR